MATSLQLDEKRFRRDGQTALFLSAALGLPRRALLNCLRFVYQRLAARSHIEQPPPGTACRRLSLALRPVPSFCAVFDLIRFVTVRLLVVFDYLDLILLAFTVCFCVHVLPMHNCVIMYTDSD